MFLFLFCGGICAVIVLAIILINLFLYKDKNSGEFFCSVESGFLSYIKKSFRFSLAFFIILLLFVLFDVEIIFVIFSPILGYNFIFNIGFIILFIILTLVFE
jgi:NADH:ubiquinone oxidoreductase subunit 3 (subunit A)